MTGNILIRKRNYGRKFLKDKKKQEINDSFY